MRNFPDSKALHVITFNRLNRNQRRAFETFLWQKKKQYALFIDLYLTSQGLGSDFLLALARKNIKQPRLIAALTRHWPNFQYAQRQQLWKLLLPCKAELTPHLPDRGLWSFIDQHFSDGSEVCPEDVLAVYALMIENGWVKEAAAVIGRLSCYGLQADLDEVIDLMVDRGLIKTIEEVFDCAVRFSYSLPRLEQLLAVLADNRRIQVGRVKITDVDGFVQERQYDRREAAELLRFLSDRNLLYNSRGPG